MTRPSDLIQFPKVETVLDPEWKNLLGSGARDWIDMRMRGMKRAHKGAAGQGSLVSKYRRFLFQWLSAESDWIPAVDDIKRLMKDAPDDVAIFRHLIASNVLSPNAVTFVTNALSTVADTPPAGT